MNDKIKFVTLEEKAAKEIKAVMKEQEIEGSRLRISVRGGGCSGFQYGLNFIEESDIDEKMDVLDEQHGIPLVIDKKSAIFIDGTIIEWVEELSQRGFKFNNPNSSKVCGCGNSFSV